MFGWSKAEREAAKKIMIATARTQAECAGALEFLLDTEAKKTGVYGTLRGNLMMEHSGRLKAHRRLLLEACEGK